jgi:hypothetical protein
VHACPAYLPLSVAILFILASTAHAQSSGSLDITIPTTYPIATTTAYNSSYYTVDVHDGIGIFQSGGGGIYVSVSTNASDGDKLAFFQDTGTWALFRNNTLVLPIHNGQDTVANFVMATGDMVSSNGRFYGLVTGMELDTKALDGGGSSASAVLYLNKLPEKASYRFAISDDDNIRKAILGEASKNGTSDAVMLMAEVSGVSQDAQNSIGYTIVRMMSGDAMQNGNVSAYRYYNGVVSRLPSKTIESANETFYETISSGSGTFAFVGPYQEPPPMRAGAQSILIFAGALALTLALLVAFIIKSLRWSAKKE